MFSFDLSLFFSFFYGLTPNDIAPRLYYIEFYPESKLNWLCSLVLVSNDTPSSISYTVPESVFETYPTYPFLVRIG